MTRTKQASRKPKSLAILGVNFSGADPNASLVIDDEIVAAVEEERFVREKHASGQFPSRAIAYCLDLAAQRGRSIDYVAFGWDCPKYGDGRMARFFEQKLNGQYTIDEATRVWQSRMLKMFHPNRIKQQIRFCLKSHGLDRRALPPIRFLSHHLTHAAGAFLLSGFEESAVLTLDGSGDDLCTGLWMASDGRLRPQGAMHMPHSLGWFYAAITEYLGFQAYDGEYKVMGLAPYGRPDPQLAAQLAQVLMVLHNGDLTYRLDPSFIHYGLHSYSGRFTDKLVKLLGRPPRPPESDPSAFHKRVAFEAQALLDRCGIALAHRVTVDAGCRKLCLAGGAAMNGKMAQRLLESPWVDDLFVLPNPGDGGQSLSAAVFLAHRLGGQRPQRLRSIALGPSFTDPQIKRFLDQNQIRHTYEKDLCGRAAADLAAGRILGWFQGRMEFGPRALGHRSILADPRVVSSRDKVNSVVKFREYWRPFSPSLLASAASAFFDVQPSDAPFMTITLPVRFSRRRQIPAVVHKDGTARPQFVHRDTDPVFHDLIRCFASMTGIPVLLNTSFNVKGEPIVCTPQEAVERFFSSGMDVLYLGSYRVDKGR